jgi:transposase
MEERTAARPDLIDRRREIVEHPFGTHDQAMDESGRLSPAWSRKVHAEFSLTALAYNLRRELNILGVEKLMDAIAA